MAKKKPATKAETKKQDPKDSETAIKTKSRKRVPKEMKPTSVIETVDRPQHKETRCAKWTFLVYPDSAPENWRDLLDEQHIEWVESPLHDRDVNPTGEPKKAHWHVMLIFGSVKAYEQVLDIIAPLKASTTQRVHNTKGMVRYMCHLDNPEKAQYKQSDIKVHGGADLYQLLLPSKTEIDMFQMQMFHYVEENDIRELAALNRYAAENEPDTWWPILTSQHATFIRFHIQSRRHQIKENESPAHILAERVEELERRAERVDELERRLAQYEKKNT